MSQAKINENLAEIERLTGKKIELETLAAEWGAQSKVPCDYKLKGRQADCLQDRDMKANKSRERLDAAKAIGERIAALTAENADLYDQAASTRTIEESLAKMGTTAEAEAIKATAEAETKKDNNTLFIVIAVVVALGVGIFVYKKFF